ncbi:unnamed protein product [Adineta ricciae]|uniref:Ras-associating domain-containing protein n=1 Tax=Adineta ricciae TaxID=249248 RepID=A0A813PIU2_ADIRI|nr:unnamed protein product [Adineta ricciae]CAF0869331.1 unnamed protein product [Adineta ricciae]
MYHRMYLRRCSMSSISEESETGDDDLLDEEFVICDDNTNEQTAHSSTNLSVENCLGDLHSFKKEIREAYVELSTLERQAQNTTSASPTMFAMGKEDDLDILLEQLHTLEQRLDQPKMFRHESNYRCKKSISPTIVAQFDELDQALATLTSTLNNVEIELGDSGNSSSSSAASDSTTVHHRQRQDGSDDKVRDIEGDEHFSDSGLSQSTDSISLPYKQRSQLRTSSQISNLSSVLSCDTLKHSSGDSKIRMALEKMHEANIRKMFVKIHNDDQSTKNILIDETMSIHDIIILLLHKYRLQPAYDHALIEDLPDLHIYRTFEDHQNLINDAIVYWPRDTNNRICFRQHENKYSMFMDTKSFFSIKEQNADHLLTDYVTSNTIVLPDDITSVLYIKEKSRKIWKKHSCILRQSGIYQLPKSSSSKRDLICLLKFDSNMQLYYANNWMEALRSPTEYGFALKYAHIQKKSNKYIHYLCTNTYEECQRWMNGIRIIQHGTQLYKNYQRMKKVIEDGPEKLAKVLPHQHYFNFIQSNTSSIMSESFSAISLPINHIVSDASKSFSESTNLSLFDNVKSLDRLKPSKTSFIRSSSFHDSLRRAHRSDQKLLRTYSISPPNTSPVKLMEPNLKRSKSSKEIVLKPFQTSRSKTPTKKDHNEVNRSSSTSSIIPFINQCIQTERTPRRSKSPIPKRPPPPLPKKLSSPRNIMTTVDNHMYESYQENCTTPTNSRQTFSYRKPNGCDEQRLVSQTRLPPMKVTEL